MEKEQTLHTDSDGKKVVLHTELDEDGNETTRWVTYERYPDLRYGYLTAEAAAEKILHGQELRGAYVQDLSVFTLAGLERRLATDQLLPRGSIDVHGERREGPVLRQPIRCYGCLLGQVYLADLILAREVGFFSPKSSSESSHVFGSADFHSTAFGGTTNFAHVTFWGMAAFVGALFSGEAEFGAAVFDGLAHLACSVFCSVARFERATFNGDTFFDGVTFNSQANFESTILAGHAGFRAARFRRKSFFYAAVMLCADFDLARFEWSVDMTKVALQRISFSQTIFGQSALISSTKAPGRLQAKLDAIAESLHRRDQEGGVLKKLDFLSRWRESGRAIHSVNLENTLVQGELVFGFSDLAPPKWKLLTPPPEKAVLKRHQERNWPEAQKQYAWLKEQYRRRGAYKDEDEAHWWASECSRKTEDICRPKFLLYAAGVILTVVLAVMTHAAGRSYITPGLQSLIDGSALIICALLAALVIGLPRLGMWFLYRKVFGYGVKPINVVISIAIVMAICTGFFWWACADGKITCDPDGSLPFESSLLNGMYFSVITFATVGYGDLSPTGWAAGLAMVEGLLGIALNAALVVVIFRKIIR